MGPEFPVKEEDYWRKYPMKKYFKDYLKAWLIVFIVFQVIAFCIPAPAGMEKFTGSFWTGYLASVIALLGQLACTWYAFSESDTKEKAFLNVPLITISFTCMVLTLIVGAVCMFVPVFKVWAEVVALVVILGFYALSVVSVTSSAKVARATEQSVKEKTMFIRSLTLDAEELFNQAAEEQKETLHKVYETVRYSDPCGGELLAELETQITAKFAELQEAVKADDADTVKAKANEFSALMEERNKKCRLYK